MNRLFVPLNTDPFEDFKYRGKRYELRWYGRQFIEKNLIPGRLVELRKGYSGERLHGTIGTCVIGSLEYIFEQIPLHLITPRKSSKEEALIHAKQFMKPAEKYVAFEVILD